MRMEFLKFRKYGRGLTKTEANARYINVTF